MNARTFNHGLGYVIDETAIGRTVTLYGAPAKLDVTGASSPAAVFIDGDAPRLGQHAADLITLVLDDHRHVRITAHDGSDPALVYQNEEHAIQAMAGWHAPGLYEELAAIAEAAKPTPAEIAAADVLAVDLEEAMRRELAAQSLAGQGDHLPTLEQLAPRLIAAGWQNGPGLDAETAQALTALFAEINEATRADSSPFPLSIGASRDNVTGTAYDWGTVPVETVTTIRDWVRIAVSQYGEVVRRYDGVRGTSSEQAATIKRLHAEREAARSYFGVER